jgi:D-3-phosphoglycerate dehydrogenase
MQQGKVLIAAPVHRILKDGLINTGYELVIPDKISQANAPEYLTDCVGIITSTRLQLDKQLLDAAPLLRWIGRMGSGMEVVDMEYAALKGIRCHSSPEGNSNAVAEHAIGMLLALSKRLIVSNNELKRAIWEREGNRGTELEGKTVGIIGFGHTGRAFAKKLLGFDMNILVYDKYKRDEVPEYVTYCKDLEAIYREADIISFHVPLQEDTIHYLDEKFISAMHKGFVLLNTSRGIVADTKAIKKGLESGKIKGACLDVWEEEPLEQMSPELRDLFEKMVNMDNVIITPHIAGYSEEALYKMSKVLLEKIVNV